MTIKEITALRKSGQLSQALAAAENEIAQNANNYTASALFWCLKDLAKQQDRVDALATLERMQSLYETCCGGDELMQKALAAVSRMLQPLFGDIKDLTEKAKAGENVYTEYKAIEELFKNNKLDETLYLDFGWLVYYVLKHTPLTDAHIRKVLLSNYLKLNLPKPSVLHSLILTEAIKVEQNTPLQFRIRDFISLWGLDNLREEDWEQFHTDDGKTLPSSVEKLIGVYAKELKTDHVESPEEFIQLVDKALERYPKSQNMPYFKASVLISQGKTDEALAYYKDLILRFPSKFDLWDHAAELIDDIDTKIGLRCKALTCGTDDEFVGGVRLRLADLLMQKNLMSNAKYELDRFRSTYENKGWRLKSEYWQMQKQLQDVQPSDDNAGMYARFAANADEFIYSALPVNLAIKVAESLNDDRNHPGRKIMTWILRTDKSVVRLRKPAKFGLNKRTPNGVAFDVKMQGDKIVWIKSHIGSISEPWVKVLSGEVRLRTDRNGKKYSIIAGSYVGGALLKDVNEGQSVKILTLLQKDDRWSAVSLTKI